MELWSCSYETIPFKNNESDNAQIFIQKFSLVHAYTYLLIANANWSETILINWFFCPIIGEIYSHSILSYDTIPPATIFQFPTPIRQSIRISTSNDYVPETPVDRRLRQLSVVCFVVHINRALSKLTAKGF